jgi:hypothetical protein
MDLKELHYTRRVCTAVRPVGQDKKRNATKFYRANKEIYHG